MSAFDAYDQTRRAQDRGTFCHAPSVNLNFEQNGNVTACCYNRSFVLGRYPENSVEEIWNGEKARELRAALAARDLSKGCHLCRGQLESRNFRGLRARHFEGVWLDREDQASSSVDAPDAPLILELEISNLCNLECVMCDGRWSSAIRKNREKLPPLPKVYGPEFVGQLRPFLARAQWVRFLGGEPFLNPLYFKIWDAMISDGVQAGSVVTTNGTILNDKVMRVLDHAKPNLVVSIDSIDRENYASIRKNASLDTVLKNMAFFSEYAKRNERFLYVAACPMTGNWQDLPALVAYCDFYGIEISFNTVLLPHEQSLRSLPPTELLKIRRHLSAHKPGLRANVSPWRDLMHQLEAWETA